MCVWCCRRLPAPHPPPQTIRSPVYPLLEQHYNLSGCLLETEPFDPPSNTPPSGLDGDSLPWSGADRSQAAWVLPKVRRSILVYVCVSLFAYVAVCCCVLLCCVCVLLCCCVVCMCVAVLCVCVLLCVAVCCCVVCMCVAVCCCVVCMCVAVCCCVLCVCALLLVCVACVCSVRVCVCSVCL